MPSCICLSTSAQQKAPEKFRVCFQKSSMVFLRLQHPCIQVELWPQSKWNCDHHLHPALHPLSTHTVRTPSHFSLNIFFLIHARWWISYYSFSLYSLNCGWGSSRASAAAGPVQLSPWPTARHAALDLPLTGMLPQLSFWFSVQVVWSFRCIVL